jgi:DNA-binding transcriptional LysR family regulator
MNITIRQLEYFLEIAKQNSISQAAEKLNISQPPLSVQLNKLEVELHTKLFDRRKHGMVITEAGIKLRDRAEQILSLVDDTTKVIINMNDSSTGTIRIGALSAFCLQLLPEKAKQFLEIYPKVDFIIQETSAQRIGELVKNGVIDIGLVRELQNASQFHSISTKNVPENFQNDEIVALGVPSYFKNTRSKTITFKELSKFPLIIFKTYEESLNNVCTQTKTECKVICRNENPISSIGWALNGIGVAILPRSCLSLVQDIEEKLIVKTITNPHISANILIITNNETKLSPIAQKFYDLFI